MKVSFVVAVAKNNAIGVNNTLPWHLPEDLKFFKRVTMGKPMIMGRATYDSIGKPLPGRPNIVITRNREYQAEGTTVVHSVDEALKAAERLMPPGQDEVTIIGGAQIFKDAFARADRLYYTEVDAEPKADTFFPEFDRNEWREVSRESHAPDERNPYPYSFVIMDRHPG
jgi:dihydrofolate reductase